MWCTVVINYTEFSNDCVMHSSLLLYLYIIWLLIYIFMWNTSLMSCHPKIFAVPYRKDYLTIGGNLLLPEARIWVTVYSQAAENFTGQLMLEMLVFPKVGETNSDNRMVKTSWREKGEVLVVTRYQGCKGCKKELSFRANLKKLALIPYR